MKSLIRLVKTLNSKEIDLIKRMQKSHMAAASRENMCMKLFDSILNNQVTSNKDAFQLVCPHKHNSTISQVKKRLELDILNVMLISSLTDEKDQLKNSDINCQKNLLLGNVLIERGLNDEAIQLLHTTSEAAGKAEFHDIKMRCDDLLMSAYREREVENTLDQYRKNMDVSIESISNLFRAKAMNYPFLHGKSFSDPEPVSDLDLKKISDHIKKSSSRKAVYWYKMAIIHHYIQQKEFASARMFACKLMNKTQVNGDMVTALERSEFYLQLSRILIFLGEIKAAIHAAECCMENSPRGGLETGAPAQMLFRGYLRLHNYEKANEIVDRALKHLKGPHDPNSGIWYLFKSTIFFTRKMYRESHQVLIAQEQSFSDSLSQKTFAKFFELVNIMELGDSQWFEYKMESFRKRLERISIKEILRIRQLYHLLNTAANSTFQHSKIPSEKVSMSLAMFNSQAIEWDPLGYEMINFGDWICSKVDKIIHQSSEFLK